MLSLLMLSNPASCNGKWAQDKHVRLPRADMEKLSMESNSHPNNHHINPSSLHCLLLQNAQVLTLRFEVVGKDSSVESVLSHQYLNAIHYQ
jgi:hypothetical protein